MSKEFITPARRKYEADQRLMEAYITSHPELKPLINAFKEAQKARAEGRRVKIIIDIGESQEEGFLTYLTSRTENPRIMFKSWTYENGDKLPKDDCDKIPKDYGNKIPKVSILSEGFPIASFTLDDMEVIDSEIEDGEERCRFNRYSFTLRFTDIFDYDICVVVYR